MNMKKNFLQPVATSRVKSLAALLVVLAMSGSAHGALVVNAIEVGGDVIFSTEAGGSLDVTGVTLLIPGAGPFNSFVESGIGEWGIGAAVSLVDIYTGNFGPASIGLGGLVNASDGSGDFIGGDPTALVLPNGYVSGASLNATSIYFGETLMSLGLAQGVYVYTLPNDTMTLNVGVVPIPAAVWLFGSALGLLGGWARRKSA